ncbi:hypothetical protein CLV80_101320 [Yoonia maritima]|uniref:Uncharacterized protein n=1 Tax=Yoonia maritima TaxID=1435347 RepID=A0A2T0W4S1_9RHOB|nr:hypothetical protein CLV80_101320 [Yoonia maritima]
MKYAFLLALALAACAPTPTELPEGFDPTFEF